MQIDKHHGTAWKPRKEPGVSAGLKLALLAALVFWMRAFGSIPNAQPVTNLTVALETAAQEQKKIFVHYGSAANPNSEALRSYLAAGSVSLPAGEFVYLLLDSDDPASEEDFANHFSVAGPALPLVVIANTNGLQLLARSGFGDVAQYQAFIEQSRNLQPPENDDFARRLVVEGWSVVVPSVFNSLATREPGEPALAGGGGASIWWQWTALSNGAYVVSTDGSAFHTSLGIYTGVELTNLSLVAEDQSSGAQGSSQILLAATGGTSYQIVVDGAMGTAGKVVLTIRPPGPPPNDYFGSRAVITGWSNSLTAWNFEATKEPGEPSHAGNRGGASVWWTWTAPGSGPATLSTEGSDFDTLLAVYTGSSLTGLSLVASNDDSGGELTPPPTFNPKAGPTHPGAGGGFMGAARGVGRHPPAQQPIILGLPTLLSNGVARLTLSSALGQTNVIEASSDLAAWVPLSTNRQSEAVMEFEDAEAASANPRFYRARKLP
jgi:hypothetical protein